MNSETKLQEISAILQKPSHRHLLAACQTNDELFVAAQFYLGERGLSDWLCFRIHRKSLRPQQCNNLGGSVDDKGAVHPSELSGDASTLKNAGRSGSQFSEIVGLLKIISGSRCDSVLLLPANETVMAFYRNLEALE
jgi:hypothetical protein